MGTKYHKMQIVDLSTHFLVLGLKIKPEIVDSYCYFRRMIVHLGLKCHIDVNQ